MTYGGTCCWRCLARLRTWLERRRRTKPLYELAEHAERHLASEHDIAVTVSRERGPKHSFDGLIAHLAELTKQPASAPLLT